MAKTLTPSSEHATSKAEAGRRPPHREANAYMTRRSVLYYAILLFSTRGCRIPHIFGTFTCRSSRRFNPPSFLIMALSRPPTPRYPDRGGHGLPPPTVRVPGGRRPRQRQGTPSFTFSLHPLRYKSPAALPYVFMNILGRTSPTCTQSGAVVEIRSKIYHLRRNGNGGGHSPKVILIDNSL
eukprot:416070-Prorocentrum_minimum.AAC.4